MEEEEATRNQAKERKAKKKSKKDETNDKTKKKSSKKEKVKKESDKTAPDASPNPSAKKRIKAPESSDAKDKSKRKSSSQEKTKDSPEREKKKRSKEKTASRTGLSTDQTNADGKKSKKKSKKDKTDKAHDCDDKDTKKSKSKKDTTSSKEKDEEASREPVRRRVSRAPSISFKERFAFELEGAAEAPDKLKEKFRGLKDSEKEKTRCRKESKSSKEGKLSDHKRSKKTDKKKSKREKEKDGEGSVSSKSKDTASTEPETPSKDKLVTPPSSPSTRSKGSVRGSKTKTSAKGYSKPVDSPKLTSDQAKKKTSKSPRSPTEKKSKKSITREKISALDRAPPIIDVSSTNAEKSPESGSAAQRKTREPAKDEAPNSPKKLESKTDSLHNVSSPLPKVSESPKTKRPGSVSKLVHLFNTSNPKLVEGEESFSSPIRSPKAKVKKASVTLQSEINVPPNSDTSAIVSPTTQETDSKANEVETDASSASTTLLSSATLVEKKKDSMNTEQASDVVPSDTDIAAELQTKDESKPEEAGIDAVVEKTLRSESEDRTADVELEIESKEKEVDESSHFTKETEVESKVADETAVAEPAEEEPEPKDNNKRAALQPDTPEKLLNSLHASQQEPRPGPAPEENDKLQVPDDSHVSRDLNVQEPETNKLEAKETDKAEDKSVACSHERDVVQRKDSAGGLSAGHNDSSETKDAAPDIANLDDESSTAVPTAESPISSSTAGASEEVAQPMEDGDLPSQDLPNDSASVRMESMETPTEPLSSEPSLEEGGTEPKKVMANDSRPPVDIPTAAVVSDTVESNDSQAESVDATPQTMDVADSDSQNLESSITNKPDHAFFEFEQVLSDCTLEVQHTDQPPVPKKGYFHQYAHPNFCMVRGDNDSEDVPALSITAEGDSGRCELRHHLLWGISAARYSYRRSGVILCSSTLSIAPSSDKIQAFTIFQIIHSSYELPVSATDGSSSKLFAKKSLLRLLVERNAPQDSKDQNDYILSAHLRRQRRKREKQYQLGSLPHGEYFDLDVYIVFDPESERYELGIDLNEENCLMKQIDNWLALSPTNYFQFGSHINDISTNAEASPDSKIPSVQVSYRKIDMNIPTGDPIDDDLDFGEESEDYTSAVEESESNLSETIEVQSTTSHGSETVEYVSDSDSSSSSSSSSGSSSSSNGEVWDEVSVSDEDATSNHSDSSDESESDSSGTSGDGRWDEISVIEEGDEEEEDEWAEVPVSDDGEDSILEEEYSGSEDSLSEVTVHSSGSAFYIGVDESEEKGLKELAERKQVQFIITRQKMVSKENSSGYSKVADWTDMSVSVYEAVKSACKGSRIFVLTKRSKQKLKRGEMIGYITYGKGENVRKVPFAACKKTPLRYAIDEVLPVTEHILPITITYAEVTGDDDEEELSD